MTTEPIIGIDLGTTNSLVGVMDAGFSVLIPDANGQRLLPSVVAWPKGGSKTLVGAEARRVRAQTPERVLSSVKRFMGRRYSDLSVAEKKQDYQLVADEKGMVAMRVGELTFSPQQVAAFVLQELKGRAELYLEREVHRAVITVPAYFNDAQRQATKEAGELAGLEVLRILSEPTAAALAYGLDRQETHTKIAVYDLGGGTFDLSILELNEGVFQVLATSGDTFLGGDDIDLALYDFLWGQLPVEQQLEAGPSVRIRLKEEAESAKIRLSTYDEVICEIPFLIGSYHFRVILSRSGLEELARPLIERTRRHCLRALQDAGLKQEDLNQVILVGGQTRMPLVRALVKDWFKREPHVGLDPDEAVAKGAVMQAGILSGAIVDMVLLDVTPLSLGIETFGGLMNVIIPRNSTIPTKAGEMFTNAVDDQRSMKICVLQGERELAKDNWKLGELDLEFQPGPRSSARVGVQFELDVNGILHVLVRDTATGQEKQVEMRSVVDVTDEKVEQMVSESVDHALEDMQERRWIETEQKAKRLAELTRKALQQTRAELEKAIRLNVEQALSHLGQKMQHKNLGELKQAMQDLDQASKPLAEHLINQAVEASLQRKGLL